MGEGSRRDRSSKFFSSGAPSEEGPLLDGFFDGWVVAIRRRFAAAPGWLSALARGRRRPRREHASLLPDRGRNRTDLRTVEPFRCHRAAGHGRLAMRGHLSGSLATSWLRGREGRARRSERKGGHRCFFLRESAPNSMCGSYGRRGFRGKCAACTGVRGVPALVLP
jgi:hypothetical protein